MHCANVTFKVANVIANVCSEISAWRQQLLLKETLVLRGNTWQLRMF